MMTILACQATRQPISNINSFSATSTRKLKQQFSWNCWIHELWHKILMKKPCTHEQWRIISTSTHGVAYVCTCIFIQYWFISLLKCIERHLFPKEFAINKWATVGNNSISWQQIYFHDDKYAQDRVIFRVHQVTNNTQGKECNEESAASRRSTGGLQRSTYLGHFHTMNYLYNVGGGI